MTNDTFTSFLVRIIRGAGHLCVYTYISSFLCYFYVIVYTVLCAVSVCGCVVCNQYSRKSFIIMAHYAIFIFNISYMYIHENRV